jgi:hypothetical protein
MHPSVLASREQFHDWLEFNTPCLRSSRLLFATPSIYGSKVLQDLKARYFKSCLLVSVRSEISPTESPWIHETIS